MEETVDNILGILDIVILDKYDERYIKFLTRNINYQIEYLEPVSIIITPKRIYVSTKNISHLDTQTYRQVITKFCCSLIEGITERYVKKAVKIKEYSHMGVYENLTTNASLDSVRMHLAALDDSGIVTIDIPPRTCLEIHIHNFDPKSGLNEECIYLELNN